MDTRTLFFIATGLALLLGGCERGDEQQPGDGRFTYEYTRPEALGPMPKEVPWLVPSVPPERMLAHTEQKAQRLAETLGVKLDSAKLERRVDPNGETLSLRDGRYRLKLYTQSGMVRFRDTTLYNRIPAAEAGLSALEPEAARKRAEEIVEQLAASRLIERDQVLLQAARVSHSKLRGGAGRPQGQGGKPAPSPVEVVDTRVFLPRAVAGLGVSGEGIRIVFDRQGAVAGLDLLWRDLQIDSAKKALPVRHDMTEARKRFERDLRLSPQSLVTVKSNELVYFDPAMRDPVAFLEPAYLFVYVVRVPIQGRADFRVSKVLHQVIPSVDHRERQLASPRTERLQRLDRALQQARPEKVVPAPTTDEGEGIGD